MKAALSHIQVNIDIANLSFYKDLMGQLGVSSIMEFDEGAGFGASNGASVWFMKRPHDSESDYDGSGVNHIGLGVDSEEEVDSIVEYLKSKNVEALFDTPRNRPDFAGETGTYYQVMFKSPDNILFEVVYHKV